MTTYYNKPSYPVFVGGKRQVGGGVVGSLVRSFLPFIRKAAAPVLKEVGKGALELGANVASDALRGENIGHSFKERAKESAIKFLDGMTSTRRTTKRRKRKRSQVGSGRVTKQTKRRRVRRRTSTVRKPKNPRKRRRKSKAPRIAAKRRRTSYI